MQIHEICRARPVNEAFPVKGLRAAPPPAPGLSAAGLLGMGQPEKPSVGSRISSALGNVAASGWDKVKRAGSETGEYLAHTLMTRAGVPADQMRLMNWNPSGTMAATLGRGSASLELAQNQIAEKLAREYARSQSLNGKKIANPTMKDIEDAIKLVNQAGQRLPINVDAAAKVYQNLMFQAKQKAQTAKPQITTAAPPPAPTISVGGQPSDPNDPATKRLLALAQQQGKI